jgi:hypothetical protein
MSHSISFRRRLSVNLSDVSVEGLRAIAAIITSESYVAKLAAETSITIESKQAQVEARARLIESGKRIERFLDR